MHKLCQRSLSPVVTAVFVGSLLGTGGLARADDEPEGPAPTASPNVATEGTGQTSTVSSNEPTFQSETSRMTWPNKPLLATGATVFGLSYLPAVIGGAVSDADRGEDLYIPVAGPWMMMSKGEDEDGDVKALLAIDGVVQGIGALMLLSSFFIPEKKTEHWYLIGSNDLRIAPSHIGTGYGMGAAGRF